MTCFTIVLCAFLAGFVMGIAVCFFDWIFSRGEEDV